MMLPGVMLDRSAGGVRFEAGQFYGKNSELLLELESGDWADEGAEWLQACTIKETGMLRILGGVMWCQEIANRPGSFELGVRFSGRIK